MPIQIFWSPKTSWQPTKTQSSIPNAIQTTVYSSQYLPIRLAQRRQRRLKAPQFQLSVDLRLLSPLSLRTSLVTDLMTPLVLRLRASKLTSTAITSAYTTSRRWKICRLRAMKSFSHRYWATCNRSTQPARRNSKRQQTSSRRRQIRLSLISHQPLALDAFWT